MKGRNVEGARRPESYDLAVIGSGAAAFAAAIAATRLGLAVVMVERGVVGGTCVNVGCVPSKALLAAAESRHQATEHRFAGISTHAGPTRFGELLAAKDALVQQMRTDKYVDLAAEQGWEIVAGTGRFTKGPALEVSLPGGGSRRIEAAQYLVATGASPRVPPVEGLEESGYLTSTTAMELDHLPESLLVIGGSYIGLEQAQLFSRLGTKVTIVESMERLAAAEEPEVDQTLRQVLADEGVTVLTGTTVTKVERSGSGLVATLGTAKESGPLRTAQASRTPGTPEASRTLTASEVLVATGLRPSSEGLGLDAVGVETGGRGEVVVDDQLRTANGRIWGAGDVTGHPQFVYVAAAQGALVVDNAFGGMSRALDYSNLPRVMFTSPNVAAVGLTDAQAQAEGIDCECRVLALEHLPRAIVNRDERGFVKVVAERATGRVLGVTVVAHNAGESILSAVYAIRAEMTVEDLASTWAPYLTMAEGIKLAAQTFTRDVAKLSCCAA
ncbi:MAG: mercury(II) reductase [Actinomycetota bacterium]|nr:mercury(II) reductase [Actinomycetota bacterium]